MKKVISFSVYGTNPKYIVGAIRNAELAKALFPSWNTVFYVSDCIPQNDLNNLRNVADAIHIKPEPGNSSGMFWRFLEGGNNQNERVIFRDSDSRLTLRDVQAVERWVESGKSLHIIRDHPMHNAPMLGGLWGIIPSALHDFAKTLGDFQPSGFYGEDQEFLWKNVYKTLGSDKLVHDALFLREIRKEKIAAIRNNWEFLGESLDENDSYDPKYRVMLRDIQHSHYAKYSLKIKSLVMKIIGR